MSDLSLIQRIELKKQEYKLTNLSTIPEFESKIPRKDRTKRSAKKRKRIKKKKKGFPSLDGNRIKDNINSNSDWVQVTSSKIARDLKRKLNQKAIQKNKNTNQIKRIRIELINIGQSVRNELNKRRIRKIFQRTGRFSK